MILACDSSHRPARLLGNTDFVIFILLLGGRLDRLGGGSYRSGDISRLLRIASRANQEALSTVYLVRLQNHLVAPGDGDVGRRNTPGDAVNCFSHIDTRATAQGDRRDANDARKAEPFAFV